MTKSRVSLEDYISEVCKQIVSGVLNAQKQKHIGKYIGVAETTNYTDDEHSFVTNVSFDVAAETSLDLSGNGKVGISVAGVEGKTSKKETTANRITFQIPVAIPLPEEIKSKNRAERELVNKAIGH